LNMGGGYEQYKWNWHFEEKRRYREEGRIIMTFCCKVIVSEAKVFIISRRSSLDDNPITLEFVNGGGCLA